VLTPFLTVDDVIWKVGIEYARGPTPRRKP
jgi:hypothetical protein